MAFCGLLVRTPGPPRRGPLRSAGPPASLACDDLSGARLSVRANSSLIFSAFARPRRSAGRREIQHRQDRLIREQVQQDADDAEADDLRHQMRPIDAKRPGDLFDLTVAAQSVRIVEDLHDGSLHRRSAIARASPIHQEQGVEDDRFRERDREDRLHQDLRGRPGLRPTASDAFMPMSPRPGRHRVPRDRCARISDICFLSSLARPICGSAGDAVTRPRPLASVLADQQREHRGQQHEHQRLHESHQQFQQVERDLA